MPWDRLLWGVEFTGARADDPPMLLGCGWHGHAPERYQGEPSRALLFTTRATARQWCAIQHDKYRGRTDCCGDWRFRPVRVRELIGRKQAGDR